MNNPSKIHVHLDKVNRQVVMANTGDVEDTITVNVSLMTRLLELSREDISSDENLHKVMERLIAASKTREVLTMADYSYIAQKEPK